MNGSTGRNMKVVLGNDVLSKQSSINNANVDYEKAVALTGFGKFQYLIIILCGLIYCCVGFQNGLNAYVMPSAQCDLKLTSTEKGLLNAVFLAGGLASAFFWGVLADFLGRKKVLVLSLMVDGVLTAISSLSQSFSLFAAFRFLNGFFIGAPGSIIFAYLGEFLTSKHRPPSLCAMGFFWTLSWMILPAAALAIMPISWSYRTENFIYNSWRIYVGMFSLPTLICGVVLALFFPESPKFLYSQGKMEETLDVLRHMYGVTYGGKYGDYPVLNIETQPETERTQPGMIQDSNSNIKPTKNSELLVHQILKQVWGQITNLFTYPLIYSTILASSLMFSNMFAYYGLGLWLPELFNRFEEHYKVSNVSATVCEITKKAMQTPTLPTDSNRFSNVSLNSTSSLQGVCSSGDISPSVFINTFIIGASCLIGNILSALLAKRLGLKLLTVVTAFVLSVCAVAIYFLRTPNQNLIISCLFLTFAGTGNMVISSAIVDLFSTKIRALAVCAAIFSGRLGAVASNLTLGFVLDVSCEVPIFLMGFVAFCGCILGFLLPNNGPPSANDENDTT